MVTQKNAKKKFQAISKKQMSVFSVCRFESIGDRIWNVCLENFEFIEEEKTRRKSLFKNADVDFCVTN